MIAINYRAIEREGFWEGSPLDPGNAMWEAMDKLAQNYVQAKSEVHYGIIFSLDILLITGNNVRHGASILEHTLQRKGITGVKVQGVPVEGFGDYRGLLDAIIKEEGHIPEDMPFGRNAVLYKFNSNKRA